MTLYRVGDTPRPLAIQPEAGGVPVDLADWPAATATLWTPAGQSTGVPATVDQNTDTVTLAWPAPFDQPGVHKVTIRVTDLASHSTGCDPALIAVEPESSAWHTPTSVRQVWADAAHIDDAALYDLLDVARRDVEAYAPALADTDPVPPWYRQAQRMHAEDIWNASRVGPSGDDGTDTFQLRPFPLDWMIKQLLRPRTGVPVVGDPGAA